MLYLISLGIGDERDLSLRGLAAGKACQRLYVEQYTTRIQTTVGELERLFGKKIRLLERADLEEKSGKILSEAKQADIGILVGGDVLFATTHLSLIIDCKKKGIPWRVIHSSSILTAVGESGLSLYKFGEIVTVPRWTEKYRPSGFYETIEKNKKAGLHSLILLDVGMTAREGMDLLLKIEKVRKKKLFQQEKIVSLSKLGSEEQVIFWGTAQEVRDWGSPSALVLPGRLNVFEQEFLEAL